jgi:uncharacterized protein YegL
MISSSLTIVEAADILSHQFIPETVIDLVERRTENGKKFGKLEIIACSPGFFGSTDDKYSPRNIVCGFLLDTSGSMEGPKITQAVNTIKQLAQIVLAERNGKTLEYQPIHAWIYVISFNSTAKLTIPFQEITEQTLPLIISQLDSIFVEGSTNYEAAFKKQSEVINEIIEVITNDPTTRRQYHFIRFFETDGEITQGSNNIHWLYNAMRKNVGTVSHMTLTFEDYVIGYGTDVDLKCLKQLASPTPPPQQERRGFDASDEKSMPTPARTTSTEYNCSSLITVVRPEDIGWQVGEILFKLIMRLGFRLNVSVENKNPAEGIVELFEYQTHQWSNETTLHSIIHNEKKPLYIQYTTTTTTPAASTEIIVKIQCENQYTGTKYKYEYSHTLPSSAASTLSSSTDSELLLLQPALTSMTPPVEQADATTEIDRAKQLVFPIILGMIKIEVFKQLRELEGNHYDKNVIVREAYKTLRMLKSIDMITKSSFPFSIAPLTANLITDVKLIIGLTAINNPKEHECIIHARRTASAEEDMFNTGSAVSRKYVENEEDYEEIAKEIIQADEREHKGDENDAAAAAAAAEEEDNCNDSIPTRIATCMTQSSRDNDRRHDRSSRKPSILRLLCARIALSKLKKQDISPETIYREMKNEFIHHGRRYDEDPASYFHNDAAYQDDTFSTPSQDDEYTQRRMNMMRQMSSPSS